MKLPENRGALKAHLSVDSTPRDARDIAVSLSRWQSEYCDECVHSCRDVSILRVAKTNFLEATSPAATPIQVTTRTLKYKLCSAVEHSVSGVFRICPGMIAVSLPACSENFHLSQSQSIVAAPISPPRLKM